ncbi:MAG: hypothetical protein IJO40_02160 [Thermoguttaceae bacterium]|nr:hypothetical protein [Thermoguttaceae bacterium]
MENVTRHAYLDLYPVDPNSTRVVVGTIHPHDEENFFLPFFYGNKMSLWKMLNLATNGELNDPNFAPRGNNRVFRERDGFEHRITLDSILRFFARKTHFDERRRPRMSPSRKRLGRRRANSDAP